jgi:hypothetical protein
VTVVLLHLKMEVNSGQGVEFSHSAVQIFNQCKGQDDGDGSVIFVGSKIS